MLSHRAVGGCSISFNAQGCSLTYLYLQVEWNVPEDPTKGHKYLYLTDADHDTLSRGNGGASFRADALTTSEGAVLFLHANCSNAMQVRLTLAWLLSSTVCVSSTATLLQGGKLAVSSL